MTARIFIAYVSLCMNFTFPSLSIPWLFRTLIKNQKCFSQYSTLLINQLCMSTLFLQSVHCRDSVWGNERNSTALFCTDNGGVYASKKRTMKGKISISLPAFNIDSEISQPMRAWICKIAIERKFVFSLPRAIDKVLPIEL
jgi:hypothetical protein